MPKGHILVIDDEPAICDLICTNLELAGFNAKRSVNGAIALQMIQKHQPDLIICDWMMPMMTGIEFLKKLRSDNAFSNIPVILLTAKDEENDRLAGFDAGADDYLSKPFSPKELLARVRAILRRSGVSDTAFLTCGDISINVEEQSCRVNDQLVSLGPLEFRLLEFFVSNPNRVFNRTQILDRVWGSNVYVDDRTVDVHIRRVRKALEPHNVHHYIQTVRGSGYRMTENQN